MRYERDAADLQLAGDRIDQLLAVGGDVDGVPLLIALRTVFREAANHYGGCCSLDCSEHAALVEAARSLLGESPTTGPTKPA